VKSRSHTPRRPDLHPDPCPRCVTEIAPASAGPVHPDQLVRHPGIGRNGDVNALRLSTKIGVECTQDDTSMIRSPVLMKAEEVTAIVGQENPALCHGVRQNFGIRNGGVRQSGIQRGPDIMPQPPQFRDDLRRNILVRIETGHSLCGLVLADLGLDFFGM
jgi:hypothetical protein